MHSICVLIFATVLLALSLESTWTIASSEEDASKQTELEQIYNKIFSRSFFAWDSDSTKQWLRQLEQELDQNDEGQKEKYDKVKKLRTFEKSIDWDCDLTKGSGDELVTYNRFFTAPDSTTPTIRVYIEICLARLYEKCKESFVTSTDKAVGRLSSNSPDDYERMVRLKELIANESDLRFPVVQFLLEQAEEHPVDETEFGGQFERYLSGPCEIVRRELNLMTYFHLFYLVDIESMGESVSQWYKVNSVCMWVLDDDERRSRMKSLFKHMTLMIERENLIIERNYRRVFQPAEPALPLKPEETHERLVWLSKMLAKQRKRKQLNRSALKRLSIVTTLLEMGQFRHSKQCDMRAVRWVDRRLDKIDATRLSPAIKTYLLHLGEQAFELCRSAMAEQVADSIQRLAWDPQWKRIFRLHELVAKIFDKTGRCGWSKFPNLLLGLIDEQAGPLVSPQMGRDEFNKQLDAALRQPCQKISHEFHYFGHVRNIWQLKLADDEMGPTVRYWFLSYKACSERNVVHNYAATEDSVYEHLLARGKRGDQSRG